jgi:hypothetical protein
MQANSITPFVQHSQAAVQVILGAQAVYTGMKRSAGEVWDKILFVLIGLPAIGVFWLFLRWMRHKIAKSFQQEAELTSDNYTSLRKEFDSLDSVREKLEKLQNLDNKRLPWYLRGVIGQVKAIGTLIIQRSQKIAATLQSLDPVPTPADGTLRPLKEDELWKQRNQAYDYLM